MKNLHLCHCISIDLLLNRNDIFSCVYCIDSSFMYYGQISHFISFDVFRCYLLIVL